MVHVHVNVFVSMTMNHSQSNAANRFCAHDGQWEEFV